MYSDTNYTSITDDEENQEFVSEFNDSHLALKTTHDYTYKEGITLLCISNIIVAMACRDLKLLYDTSLE